MQRKTIVLEKLEQVDASIDFLKRQIESTRLTGEQAVQMISEIRKNLQRIYEAVELEN